MLRVSQGMDVSSYEVQPYHSGTLVTTSCADVQWNGRFNTDGECNQAVQLSSPSSSSSPGLGVWSSRSAHFLADPGVDTGGTVVAALE